DGAHDLRAPRADQPGQRNDLAGVDVEADVVEDAPAGQAADLQQHVAHLGVALGVQLRDVAADHAPHEVVDGDVGDAVGGHVAAVTQHRHEVTQAEDLVEAVGDEQ